MINGKEKGVFLSVKKASLVSYLNDSENEVILTIHSLYHKKYDTLHESDYVEILPGEEAEIICDIESVEYFPVRKTKHFFELIIMVGKVKKKIQLPVQFRAVRRD